MWNEERMRENGLLGSWEWETDTHSVCPVFDTISCDRWWRWRRQWRMSCDMCASVQVDSIAVAVVVALLQWNAGEDGAQLFSLDLPATRRFSPPLPASPRLSPSLAHQPFSPHHKEFESKALGKMCCAVFATPFWWITTAKDPHTINEFKLDQKHTTNRYICYIVFVERCTNHLKYARIARWECRRRWRPTRKI